MKLLPVKMCGNVVYSKVDDDVFAIVHKYSWSMKKDYVGRSVRLGRGAKSKQTVQKLHRLIVGNPKYLVVDHINRDPLDNRRCNLRICFRSENNRNRRKTRGESKYKGVSIDKRLKYKKWRATIKVNDRYINLGYYLTEEEAAKAYDNAAKTYFGEFATTNQDLALYKEKEENP